MTAADAGVIGNQWRLLGLFVSRWALALSDSHIYRARAITNTVLPLLSLAM